MAFDNTKYHCEINSVPYNIAGYQRTEQATFVPRLSSGDQEESDFDILKTNTLPDFSGGALQREQIDDKMLYAIEGMITRYNDDLYVNNAMTSETGKFHASLTTQVTAVLNTFFGLVVACRFSGSPATGGIFIISSSHVVTSVNMAALDMTGIGSYPVALAYDDTAGYVMVWTSKTTQTVGYIADPLGSPAWTEITGGTNMVVLRATYFRGAIYVTNSSHNILYRWTGTTSTESYTQLATFGRANISAPTHDMVVYNNRIYCTRAEGLWAYDGIQMVTVEDRSAEPRYGQTGTARNYAFPSVLQGYMYWCHADGIYRFNGSLIEKIYSSSEIGRPTGMSPGDGKLWITFGNQPSSSSYPSSRYEKSMGYDFTSTSNMTSTLWAFDGRGLYCYGRIPTTTETGVFTTPVFYEDRVYVFPSGQSARKTWYVVTTEPSAGTYAFTMVTSIFDGGFPQIDKAFENLELAFDGTVTARTLTLEYRTSGFDTSSWTSYGTIDTSIERKRVVWKTIPAGFTFRKIQFRITGSIDPTFGIEKLIMRYMLAPDYKSQWTFTALCFGDDSVAPLMLADDTEGSQTVAALRTNIYAARNSKVPIKFLDVDQLDLNGAINSAVTSVVLNSTDLIKGSDGFIQIDDEIMYWSAKTSTTLTVLRGQLGTSAASHSDNAKVFIVYRAIIKSIQNERIVLRNPDDDTVEGSNRSSEITLTLSEV